MGQAARRPTVKAVIFDLDEVLIDSRKAWQYALEEAVVGTGGRRVDAAGLVDEYRSRPWAQAVSVVVEEPAQRRRCEELCGEIYYRSGLKRLLVHEGVGLGLDRIRAGRVEIAAISRERHDTAIKQIQSTGVDRFLSVLSATREGEVWDARARFEECREFLGRSAGACAYVSGDASDLGEVGSTGAECYVAEWARRGKGEYRSIATPAEVWERIRSGGRDRPGTLSAFPAPGAGTAE
jgi:beta-phosphoglucomutase-like phosphatase (HAD superfamily)